MLTLLLISLNFSNTFSDYTQASGTYHVGLAQIDITPSYPVRLNGFGSRRTESEGITQKIWARAMAIGKDDPIIIVAVDTLGISDAHQKELAGRLAKKANLKPDHLLMTATHTHTSPMLTGVTPTIFGVPIPEDHQKHIDKYTMEYLDKLEEVALESLNMRARSRLSYAIGSVEFAANRRTKGGPVDHDLPVLFVHDLKGKLLGLWCNYACHCVTLSNNKISGDWAGFAAEQIILEHPGVIPLFSIGCGADSNPNARGPGDKLDFVQQQGLELAREVARLIKGYTTPLSEPIQVQWKRFTLPLQTLPTRKEWEEKAKRTDAIGHHARVNLARLDRGEKLIEEIPYSVSTLSFGKSLAMLFLPGEVVVDYSLRLKQQLDSTRLIVHAYANGAPCYIPSERILKEGGYEGGGAMIYYDVPVPLKTGLEKMIIDHTLSLLPEFRSPFDSSKVSTRPLTPQQSLKTLKTAPQYDVELVAAEPMVIDPVAINFGPDGKLWVAEMNDYPTGKDGKFTPAGRVRFLTSSKNDGRFDQSTLFLENIPFPTGITPWRKGVLICAAPDILYAEDTDGDGKADIVKKLFSGFGTTNYQARVNSLEYGLDGWIYGSCGLYGGRITSFASDKPVWLGNRDFRIKPDTGEIEPASGQTQQGRVRDDWGTWFGSDNSNLARHYPIQDEVLRRNPSVAPPVSSVSIAADAEANRLYPAKKIQLFALSGPSGQPTAACGIGCYRDNLLGTALQNNLFTCEPVNLCVHRLVLTPNGCTFKGHRAPEEKETEFLTSTDNWFRPVQMRTGPDGAIYFVDMYRYIIEHPMWIPPDERPKLDFHAGNTMGRIYRIVPRDKKLRHVPRLDQMKPEQLVAALDTENGTVRDLVMQWMIWNPNRAYIFPLTRMVKEGKSPTARMQAIMTLQSWGPGSVINETISMAMEDPHHDVKRWAVYCAGVSPGADLFDSLLDKLMKIEYAPLRFQLSVSAGNWRSEARAGLITSLANRCMESKAPSPGCDEYIQTALLTSIDQAIAERLVSDFEKWKTGPSSPFRSRFIQVLAEKASVQTQQSLAERMESSNFDFRDWVGFFHGWDRTKTGFSLDQHPGMLMQLDAARKSLRGKSPLERRLSALELLGRFKNYLSTDIAVIGEVMQSTEPLEIQKAAIATLGRIGGKQAGEILMNRWNKLLPPQQLQVIDLLLNRIEWINLLLDGLEKGVIPKEQLDASTRQRLLQHSSEPIRNRAGKLFASLLSHRSKVVEQYQDVLGKPGDKAKGEAIFLKSCSVCHRLGDKGHNIGPDMATLLHKPPSYLLTEILDPNRNVDSRYLNYIAVLKNGQEFTGLISGETSGSITFTAQEGKTKTILRTDLEELKATGKSLMPEGLENDLKKQDLIDLFAYFASLHSPPKIIHGNTPKLITQSDGKYSLLARYASIYGRQITFEAPIYNIGYWHDVDDHVHWEVEIAQPGIYDLYLDFSCAPGSEGNSFRIDGLPKPLVGKVSSTGGWERYEQKKLETYNLSAGKLRLSVSAVGPAFNNALMDLRGIYLVPTGNRLELVPQEPPREKLNPGEVAALLLDPKQSSARKSGLIDQNTEQAAQIIESMTRDLSPPRKEDRVHPEEYNRIPWVWRVAITASKKNKPEVVRELFLNSLPKNDEPWRDWQAVVLGGGIINAWSQLNLWPGEEVRKLLGTDAELKQRWQRVLDFSIKMADDEKVPTGTRYDALRIISLEDWSKSAPLLNKYLAKGTNTELQMGAISALSDVRQKEVVLIFVRHLEHLTGENRKLALDALLRSSERIHAFLDIIEKNDTLQPLLIEVKPRLLKHSDPTVVKRL